MLDHRFYLNGIDGRSGDYLLSLSEDELVAAATGRPIDEGLLAELQFRVSQGSSAHYGVVQGVDPSDLAQTGWGVVFALVRPGSPEETAQQTVLEALRPLLRLRQSQAARVKAHYYREYTGVDGVLPDEEKNEFLARHGAGPGPADPETVPYYLLLVGDPASISYDFQSQLGVQRAVGRLHFQTAEEYACYANSVVAAETGGLALQRRAAFVGVANDNDPATTQSAKHLIAPLARALSADPRYADWTIEHRTGAQATRDALSSLLCSGDAPALLFSASHGMSFPNGDRLQIPHNGALLCQDWPGPQGWRGKPMPEDFYLAGDHLTADTNLLGTLSFLFACYGAGTPQLDDFYKAAFKDRAAIAPHAFVAALPQAMLNRPKGGALAVIGHVERAWGTSFLWEGSGEGGAMGPQTAVFKSTLCSLLEGMPVGAAMEYFDARYAELSTDLTQRLKKYDAGLKVNPYALAKDWTANNDAAGYAVLGDPAVRLCLGMAGAERPRSAVEVVAVARTEPAPEPAQVVAPEPNLATGHESYRWGSGSAEPAPVQTAAPSAIARFVNRMGEVLSKALEDTTSLEVSTWVASDLTQARMEGGRMVGAELRAFTRVALDGDTIVCLPERDGEVDREVWDIHLAMVKQAQETRAELIKALVAAAGSLARLGG